VRVPLPFASREALPIAVVPSANVTLPVGVPDAPHELDTAAVRVIDWPKLLGFGAVASAVADDLLLIVCVKGDEVVDVWFASPEYCAVRT
jgi:hypothetical protein